MSATGHQSVKPPKYDGKGGRNFEMWVMKQKAWLHNIGCEAVFSPGFDGTLSATKDTVFDLTQPAEKAQSVVIGQNYKAVNGCILSFEMPEMMNKVIEEQNHDPDWPGGKFTRIWTRIKEDEKPDDTMDEFKLDKDLRKIMHSRNKDPKDLLAEISVVEIKFGIKIRDVKKSATIRCAGKWDYGKVMTITRTITKTTAKRKATPKEIVMEMHKQC